MNLPKSIYTKYDGVQFRSKLEARWSVIFDLMGVEWQYEHQLFQVQIGKKMIKYLPDFYLPELDCWIEIKGKHPTTEEFLKIYAVSLSVGRPAYIFSGSIPRTPYLLQQQDFWSIRLDNEIGVDILSQDVWKTSERKFLRHLNKFFFRYCIRNKEITIESNEIGCDFMCGFDGEKIKKKNKILEKMFEIGSCINFNSR